MSTSLNRGAVGSLQSEQLTAIRRLSQQKSRTKRVTKSALGRQSPAPSVRPINESISMSSLMLDRRNERPVVGSDEDVKDCDVTMYMETAQPSMQVRPPDRILEET